MISVNTFPPTSLTFNLYAFLILPCITTANILSSLI
jgi:hypothetical protein